MGTFYGCLVSRVGWLDGLSMVEKKVAFKIIVCQHFHPTKSLSVVHAFG